MPSAEKPHICASLSITDSILRDYCRYIFPEREEGLLKVTNKVMFGRLLISHLRASDTPVPFNADPQSRVTFSFPILPSSRTLESKWLYYDKVDTESLNDTLKAIFDQDFYVFYFNGLHTEYQKRDIINAFIASRKLYSRDDFDVMSKRAYRKEQRYQKAIFAKLLNRAERIDKIL